MPKIVLYFFLAETWAITNYVALKVEILLVLATLHFCKYKFWLLVKIWVWYASLIAVAKSESLFGSQYWITVQRLETEAAGKKITLLSWPLRTTDQKLELSKRFRNRTRWYTTQVCNQPARACEHHIYLYPRISRSLVSENGFRNLSHKSFEPHLNISQHHFFLIFQKSCKKPDWNCSKWKFFCSGKSDVSVSSLYTHARARKDQTRRHTRVDTLNRENEFKRLGKPETIRERGKCNNAVCRTDRKWR